MTKAPRDIGASVRARLLRLARERGEDFQLVLVRYANERFLYRLSVSSHANQFVLKGAALFTLWNGAPHRTTRDLDLLGFGDSTAEHLASVFANILQRPAPDDGIAFDLQSLSTALIREEQEYGGIRVTFDARVTTARVCLQVDVGFGDAITPRPVDVEFPALLEFPAPKLRAYPRETVIAEKFEAMVKLGMANSRMKDFFDVRALSDSWTFDGRELVRAVRATFQRRGTPFPKGLPIAFTGTFATSKEKQAQWAGFVTKSGIGKNGGSLEGTVEAVRAFLEPVLHAARAADDSWSAAWHADIGWGARS